MADPAGLSAAVLVGELCALGYSYPNIKYYTKKEVFSAFRVSKEDEIARKPAFFGRIWRRRAERGPNQRGEPAGRALYRRRGWSPRPTGGWMSARALHSPRSLHFRGSGRILLAQQAQRGRRWNADPTGETRNNLNNFFTASNTPADSKCRAVARQYKSCFHKVVSNILQDTETPRSESNTMLRRLGRAEHKPQR